jgi:serine/threonine protein kinase
LQIPEPNPAAWSVLRNCRALSMLSDVVLRELIAAGEERSFQPGAAMVRQGDAAEGLLILLEGTAHASLREQDGTHHLGSFATGDIVGEMALVTREPRSADVIADSPVRALLVSTDAFDRLAQRRLELGVLLTELVADRLGQGAHDGFGGKKVEAFRILRCIGRGGMSVVYQAQNESTGELVALKMMSYRLIYDAKALARFHQEANLLHSLRHENIASLKRLFPAYHTYFLVMELCEGVDLANLIGSRGPLAESQVRPILGQLARALDYVHARGLAHRDLKPANVMITRDARIKLMDFGLAMPVVHLEDAQTTTANQIVMGTPAFMAPEQLSGGQVDNRSDVYALGCLAYELLTGRHLYSATNLFELVQQKLTLQLPPAAAIGGGVSDELYEFLQRATRVNPDERPASVAQLLEWAAPCDPPPKGGDGAAEDTWTVWKDPTR